METIFLLSLLSSAVPTLITYIPTSRPSLSSLWRRSPSTAGAAGAATRPPLAAARLKGGDPADTVDDLPALRAAARRAHAPSTFVEYARLSRRIAAVEAAAAGGG